MDFSFSKSNIFNGSGEQEPITFTKKDLEVKRIIKATDNLVLRKSRQMGLTTILRAMCAEELLGVDGTSICYVAPSASSKVRFLMNVRDLLLSFGDVIEEVQDNSIKLKNGSEIFGGNASDAFVGKRFERIIFDDCFYNDLGRKLFIASRPIMPKTVLISTPEPLMDDESPYEDVWKQIYFKALINDNNYEICDYMWWECERFNKDMVFIRGRVILPYKENDPAHNERLKQYGFRLVSPTYENYLKMYGYDANFLEDEFDEFIKKILEEKGTW
jgi:hypothetical protein